MWIITNDRILDIEQHGLFARTVSELRLHRVQDVTAEIKALIEPRWLRSRLSAEAAWTE